MFVIYSVPFVHGKERPRFGRGRTHSARETKANEGKIRRAYEDASVLKYGRVVSAPQHVPVAIFLRCTVPAPKSRPGWCPKSLWDLLQGIPFVKTPDYDNIAKEHSDALNGVAYHDDAQVTEAHIWKLPQRIGGREEARVLVMWEEK